MDRQTERDGQATRHASWQTSKMNGPTERQTKAEKHSSVKQHFYSSHKG